jgi:hypothetical protein
VVHDPACLDGVCLRDGRTLSNGQRKSDPAQDEQHRCRRCWRLCINTDIQSAGHHGRERLLEQISREWVAEDTKPEVVPHRIERFVTVAKEDRPEGDFPERPNGPSDDVRRVALLRLDLDV